MKYMFTAFSFFISSLVFGGGPEQDKKEKHAKNKSISAIEKGEHPSFAEMAEKEKKGRRWVCHINLSR